MIKVELPPRVIFCHWTDGEECLKDFTNEEIEWMEESEGGEWEWVKESRYADNRDM